MINGSPIAQTFTITASKTGGLVGTFITQIGLYFSNKSVTAGMSVYICETSNGIPNTSMILGKAKLLSSQITTSDDSTSETIFTFDNPVYINTNKQYAFIVLAEASSPDYNIWISETGATDIITGQAINSQPYSGTLYGSSDGQSWTPYQTQDIKFNLYRAKFSSSIGQAVFRNKKRDFISVANIVHANTSTTILIGDVAVAANTANLSQFLTSDFTTYPYGVVEYIDEARGVYYLKDTNGKFNVSTYPNLRFFRVANPSNTAQYTSTNLTANATLVSIDNPSYHGIIPKFLVTNPVGTYLSYNYFGVANSSGSFAKDTAPVVPTMEQLFEFRDQERVIMSYSNEVATGGFGNVGTSTYIVELATNNYLASPSLRLDTNMFNYIRNDVNNDLTNEHTRYGNARSKYISKVVVLNQVAEDLHVYITGYRPVGSDIVVWGKFLNSDSDTDAFDTKTWTQLAYTNGSDVLYSSPKDQNDVKEFTYGLPTSAAHTNSAYADPVGVTGIIPVGTLTYLNSLGSVIRGFNQFAIKIDLVTTNPVLYPFMRDVRGIALQI